MDNFSISLETGDLVGLIGPNGAGKTTAFNLLTGVYAPTSGDIVFEGKSIAGMKPFKIAAAGISRTFQNIRLFPDLSVFDNVRVASHLHMRHGLASAILRTATWKVEEDEIGENVKNLLHRFELDRVAGELAKNLPYGQQRRLEIVRALATHPRLLLLDEPAAGMNPQEKMELMDRIRSLRDDFGLTILLIEHDMKLVMTICERIAVLDYGEVIAEGTPEAVRADRKVIEAYLGEAVAA